MQAVYKILLNLILNNDTMKPFLPLLLLLLVFNVHAQERKSEKQHEHLNMNSLASSAFTILKAENYNQIAQKVINKELPAIIEFNANQLSIKNINPFLTFSFGWNEVGDEAGNSEIAISFSTDNQQWSSWETTQTDEHYEKTNYSFVSRLMFAGKEIQYYKLRITTNLSKKGKALEYLFINFFSPGEVDGLAATKTTLPPANRLLSCTAPLPSFVSRVGWNCPQAPWIPLTTTVTHLIVHHAAGTNVSSDWGAVVLGIWNFHTGTNGYSDIGYNWLVAPNGVLYEGRYNSSTSNIQGAHFCGTNQNTMGVCMLGDYTNISITAAARTTLVQVLGWKACERAIDPLATSFHANSGLTINNISGHRDGCATQCPGNTFYPDLPGVRIDVKNYIDGLTPVTIIDGLEEFSISPNPVSQSAFIKLKFNTTKEMQYRILSADGRIVFQSALQKVNGVFRQEITGLKKLPAATYTLQLWVNKQMTSKQLIKQ